MIRKNIIVVRTLMERPYDDRTQVFSPGGAADVSPGRESGDHEGLENPLSPRGATRFLSVAPPGLWL